MGIVLQWGHAFSGVETRRLGGLLCLGVGASMGPRLFRRGDGEGTARLQHGLHASMGPRLFRRGDGRAGRAGELQIGASIGPRLRRRGDLAICDNLPGSL